MCVCLCVFIYDKYSNYFRKASLGNKTIARLPKVTQDFFDIHVSPSRSRTQDIFQSRSTEPISYIRTSLLKNKIQVLKERNEQSVNSDITPSKPMHMHIFSLCKLIHYSYCIIQYLKPPCGG